jgi:hypothetical protein
MVDRSSLHPKRFMMKQSDGEPQIVDFLSGFPNRGTFFLRTGKQGLCRNQEWVRGNIGALFPKVQLVPSSAIPVLR